MSTRLVGRDQWKAVPLVLYDRLVPGRRLDPDTSPIGSESGCWGFSSSLVR